MDQNYDDIINLPHHVSTRHKPMPLHNRAAQFAPFAALTGYSDALDDTAMRYESSFDETNITGDNEEQQIENGESLNFL